jgi:hypothetical protein
VIVEGVAAGELSHNRNGGGDMGLIRGTLHLATYGAVSPKSKKQRMASRQLAAMQGKSEAEIKAAGGRNFDIVNQANLRAKQQRELRRAAQRADLQRLRQETEVRQPTPQSDAISELERLAALHQSGALDDDEFRAAKEHIIGTLAQKPADISGTTDMAQSPNYYPVTVRNSRTVHVVCGHAPDAPTLCGWAWPRMSWKP